MFLKLCYLYFLKKEFYHRYLTLVFAYIGSSLERKKCNEMMRFGVSCSDLQMTSLADFLPIYVDGLSL